MIPDEIAEQRTGNQHAGDRRAQAKQDHPAKVSVVKLVIPLFAGVAAAAAFLLPGPAPMLLASQMHGRRQRRRPRQTAG
jgi:predicted metal-binding membrane protein